MLKKQIRFGTALPILVVFAVSAVGFSNHLAEEKTRKPDYVYTEAQCVRCHTSDKAIKAMQDKAGGTARWSSYLSADAAAKCPVNVKKGSR